LAERADQPCGHTSPRPSRIARARGRRMRQQLSLRARLLGLSARRPAHGRPAARQDRQGDPIPDLLDRTEVPERVSKSSAGTSPKSRAAVERLEPYGALISVLDDRTRARTELRPSGATVIARVCRSGRDAQAAAVHARPDRAWSRRRAQARPLASRGRACASHVREHSGAILSRCAAQSAATRLKQQWRDASRPRRQRRARLCDCPGQRGPAVRARWIPGETERQPCRPAACISTVRSTCPTPRP
jgi:hypothetical protein